MSKAVRILLIVGAALVVIGLAVFCVAMMALKWDFTKLSNVVYENNDHKISESIDGIYVKADVADIVFRQSDDGTVNVSCYEKNDDRHSVRVDGGKLVIEASNVKRPWYQYINITFDSPKITVYLPAKEYNELVISTSTGHVELPKELSFNSIDILSDTGDISCYSSVSNNIKIKTDTGAVSLDGVLASSIDVSLTTGNVNISNVNCTGDISVKTSTGKQNIKSVRCNSLTVKSDTGRISLNDAVAANKLSTKLNTGDLDIIACDAGEIFIKTSTGDVEGSLLSDKVFITKTSTGKVSVPSSVTGGKCEIITSTGDINITFVK